MEGSAVVCKPRLCYFPAISAKTSEVSGLPIKTQVRGALKEPKSHLNPVTLWKPEM